jgi:hypothetical protein
MSLGRVDCLKELVKNDDTSLLDPMYRDPRQKNDTRSGLLANSAFAPIAETPTKTVQTEKNASPEFKRPK